MSEILKFTALLCAVLICTVGCSQDCEPIQMQDGKTFSLTAPNGQMIAKSFTALENETAEIIEQAKGERKEFQITNIAYYPVKKGYLVEVNYITYDNISGNYFKTDNSSEIETAVKPVRLKSDTESGDSSPIGTYYCKNKNRQKCSDCVISVLLGNNGYMTFSCSCPSGDGTYCEVKERD
jgi:hypothetical protein